MDTAVLGPLVVPVLLVVVDRVRNARAKAGRQSRNLGRQGSQLGRWDVRILDGLTALEDFIGPETMDLPGAGAGREERAGNVVGLPRLLGNEQLQLGVGQGLVRVSQRYDLPREFVQVAQLHAVGRLVGHSGVAELAQEEIILGRDGGGDFAVLGSVRGMLSSGVELTKQVQLKRSDRLARANGVDLRQKSGPGGVKLIELRLEGGARRAEVRVIRIRRFSRDIRSIHHIGLAFGDCDCVGSFHMIRGGSERLEF